MRLWGKKAIQLRVLLGWPAKNFRWHQYWEPFRKRPKVVVPFDSHEIGEMHRRWPQESAKEEKEVGRLPGQHIKREKQNQRSLDK